MAFSLDAAVDVLKVLDRPIMNGHSGIFAFQKDYVLYLIGRKSVAMISEGVSCSPRAGHHDETLDAYICKPFEGEPGKIDESELRYFESLVRDFDGGGNTLQELLNLGKKIRKDSLDDGRILMLDHEEVYHSHKHGYAADGVDVYLTGARIMMRDEYFDLIRMHELRARKNLETKTKRDAEFALPGVSVLTSNFLVSFPFPTKLRIDRINRFKDSPIISGDMFSFQKKVAWGDESPYSFNVMMFGGATQYHSSEEFAQDYEDTSNMIEKLKDCFTSSVQSVINEANSAHNTMYAKEIEDRKSFREGLKDIT